MQRALSTRDYATEDMKPEDVPLLAYDDPRAIDFRTSMQTWFSGTPWSSLTRAHLLSWLSWSMFNSSFEGLSREQENLVDRAGTMMERRAGSQLPTEAGVVSNGERDIKPLRLTLDPFTVQSRPLIAYAVINLVGFGVRRWFQWKYGVRYEVAGEMT